MEIIFWLVFVGLGGAIAHRFFSYKISKGLPPPPPLPPAHSTHEYPRKRRNLLNRSSLNLRKESTTKVESYNVPMDISPDLDNLPDDEILPPPREIDGINNE